MALQRSHMFLSKINGKNISYDTLDYTIGGLYNRLKFAKDVIQNNDEFLQVYFDDYYPSCPTCEEYLSHQNNICKKIESIGTYILSQVEDKRKLEYKFYNGDKNFENTLKKEFSLDCIVEKASRSIENQTDGDVMHFLQREENAWYLPKNIKVLPEDFERQDEIGYILRQYKSFKDVLVQRKQEVQKSSVFTKKQQKWNTTKLKYMIGSIENDMLDVKTQLLKPIVFSNTLKGSTHNCWNEVDFLNPIHVECFLKLSTSATNFDDDLSLLLNYFNTILKKVERRLTYEEKEILRVVRWGIKTIEKVNEALKIGFCTGNVNKLIQLDVKELNLIVSHIVYLFIKEYHNDMQNYLDLRRDNSQILNLVPTKVCKCCGKTKPLTSFVAKKDMKDGYRNQCKQCVKVGIK